MPSTVPQTLICVPKKRAWLSVAKLLCLWKILPEKLRDTVESLVFDQVEVPFSSELVPSLFQDPAYTRDELRSSIVMVFPLPGISLLVGIGAGEELIIDCDIVSDSVLLFVADVVVGSCAAAVGSESGVVVIIVT